ncbi:hypothetical protein H0H87_000893 [Tephrocybe sp. NHM501043]|nr:hypothetical protein H0H87_000893 [Tephrocybe sp. NHM501043]
MSRVITSSLANGPLVLRHELGHSIIDVGEEYDGGFAYFGVNAYHDLSEPVPWAHWLTSEQALSPRVEKSVMPMQLYPWTLLNASTPWSTTFSSSGSYPRHLLKFSLSGLPDANDLKVELDDVDLGWVPRKDIGLDRWHYDIPSDTRLAPGPHEVKFSLINQHREGAAQLCSVEVLEFETEGKFISTPENYGVYPTFSDQNKTSYRPTNDDCLMRSVITPNFCKVCIEGLWLSLLRRVDLIDDVKEDCEREMIDLESGDPGWLKTFNLKLVPLAQFRSPQARANETYAIKWWKDNKLLKEFTNKTRIALSDSKAIGTYLISVAFATDEVRLDKDKLLSSSVTYEIKDFCGSGLT